MKVVTRDKKRMKKDSGGRSKQDSFRAELDSHADQCCVGSNVMILSTHSKKADVKPFLSSLGTVSDVPIVTAAIVYDNPENGHPIVLVIHQALYFKDMKNILLCPMQLRVNDVVVNECPKFLCSNPSPDSHCIKMGGFRIPLSLYGINSYFPFRTPTTGEFNNAMRYELTAPDPEWDPKDRRFQEEEEALSNVLSSDDDYCVTYNRNLLSVTLLSPHDFFDRCVGMIYVLPDDEQLDIANTAEHHRDISALMTERTTYRLTPEQLSRTWGIGLPLAKRTLEATTQRGVRTTMYPTIERRWPTGDRALRYKRLPHIVFHDTLKSGIKSLRGNKMAEMYATDFCWSRVFPMVKEADVHETLDLFFNRYGVPEALVSDGARAYTGGKFRAKARQAGCYCKLHQ